MNIDTMSCKNVDNTGLRGYHFDLRKDLCFICTIWIGFNGLIPFSYESEINLKSAVLRPLLLGRT